MGPKPVFFRVNKRIDEELDRRFAQFLEKLKEKPPPPDSFVYLLFDSPGGDFDYSAAITQRMEQSGFKFYGVAVERVHSAAIPIYLFCHAWFAYGKATALIHRARPIGSISKRKTKQGERQVFTTLAKRLSMPLRDVYAMADSETVIRANTEIGRKFFLNIT